MSAVHIESGPSRGEWTRGNDHTPQVAQAARPFRNQVIRRAMLFASRGLLNRLILTLAGGRLLKMIAVIHHQGRRSGRLYSTPAGARLTAEGFIIPMTFGPQADWVKNVWAASGCVIEWNGAEYPVVDPEIVDWATGRSAFPIGMRTMLHLIGMANFVRLRHAPGQENNRA